MLTLVLWRLLGCKRNSESRILNVHGLKFIYLGKEKTVENHYSISDKTPSKQTFFGVVFKCNHDLFQVNYWVWSKTKMHFFDFKIHVHVQPVPEKSVSTYDFNLKFAKDQISLM